MENYLKSIGIGRMYWNVSEERIIPIDIISSYIYNLDKNISEGKGLLLSGGVGVGKTTILSWIAQHSIKIGKGHGYRDGDQFVRMNWENKYTTLFCSISRLFNLIYERRFDLVEEYKTVDLLLLDDFGREYTTDFPVSIFEDFIEHRYASLLSTCITTNLSRDQLLKYDRYARVIDRWRDKKLFSFIEIAGESQRPKGKK